MPCTVLLVDADHPLSQALAERLRAQGHRVVTHVRQAPGADAPAADVVAADLAAALPQIEAAHGPLDRIVFGLNGQAESFDSPADVDRTRAGLERALLELKAGAQLLTRRDDSQLWVLLPEDSMQYYLPVPAQPVRSRALMAAVKSMAKELFRLGVRVNALQVQPMAEQFDAPRWREAKEGLKAYALKFKPQPGPDVAALLQSLLALPRLALVGMVLPVGIGYPESNV